MQDAPEYFIEEPEVSIVPHSTRNNLGSTEDMSQFAQQLLEQARSEGLSLTGEGGLLTDLTRKVLQGALEAEMAEHLGYGLRQRSEKQTTNFRNGSTPKTVKTEIGEVTVDIPRDREGSFTPEIVPKHKRRIDGFNDQVLALYAKGMTTGDIASYLEEVYSTKVSRELVSKVTDAILPEMKEWQNRALERIYPIVFIDAIYLKVRDGTVATRPVHVALGIDCEGNRDVLGMWLSTTSGEGAKQWMGMLTDLKNRGVADVCIVCCDGLTGISEAIGAIWPAATIQRCVVHLIRNSLRYAQRKDMREVAADLKPVYTAPNEEAALQALSRFKEKWDSRYQAISQVWERCWSEFIPFLSFPAEVRKVIYTTNSIESLNSRFRKAVRRRGHFPNEQSALKVLYLCVIRKEKNRPNVMNKINDWTQVYNTLSLMYGDRLEVR